MRSHRVVLLEPHHPLLLYRKHLSILFAAITRDVEVLQTGSGPDIAAAFALTPGTLYRKDYRYLPEVTRFPEERLRKFNINSIRRCQWKRKRESFTRDWKKRESQEETS